MNEHTEKEAREQYQAGNRIFVNSKSDGMYTGEIINAGNPGYMGQFLTVKLDVPQWIEGRRGYWRRTITLRAGANEEAEYWNRTRVRILSKGEAS